MSDNHSPAKMEKIADRIQKLINLAQGGATEEEAASAMQKVQDLLAQYNLDLAYVEARSSEAPKVSDETHRVKENNQKNAMYKYQQDLMHTIAEVNFCYYRLVEDVSYATGRKQTKKSHFIVGREANVISAKLMFQYLNATLERLVPITKNSERCSKWALSWKEGCAYRLRERLVARKEELEKFSADSVRSPSGTSGGTSGGTALVLASVYRSEADANYEFAHDLEPGTLARWEREREERLAKRKAEVVHADEPPPKPKTEAQLRKERERAERIWERWERRRQRELAKKDWSAFNAGYRKGDDVGLETQIGENKRRILPQK